MNINYKWTSRLTLITPIVIVVCIFLMGGGHGWYTPTIILFPWATISLLWQNHLSDTVMIVGMSQFIIYGLLIDTPKSDENRKLTAILILILHIIVVFLIFYSKGFEWR